MLKTQNYNNIIATFRFKGIATLHERKMSATKTAHYLLKKSVNLFHAFRAYNYKLTLRQYT